MNQQNLTSESLNSFGVKITETMTTPSKPGKKPRPVWVVSGNTFGLESFFREMNGRKFRGAWSFFENPSDVILHQLQSHGRQSYAEQIEGEIDRKVEKAKRYETYASNAEARAESRSQSAARISSFIPVGQPILVGHHSERRHRRDIECIRHNVEKSIEESEKAEYLKGRAFDLSHAQSKLENRRYVGNRIKDAKKELSQLSKWADMTNPRVLQAQEARITGKTALLKLKTM